VTITATEAVGPDDERWAYRQFTVTGKIYSPKKSIAQYRVFWALRNSNFDDAILIDNIEIEEEQ
jgi:hypothetical protein